MIPHDYTALTLGKLFFAIGGMGGSTLVIAAETAASHPMVQYGALGVLGACAIYVVTKVVPLSIESRKEETKTFIGTLTTEREKLVASMEKLQEHHSERFTASRREAEKLLRDLNKSTIEERKVWADLMQDANVIHAKNYGVLRELSSSLEVIKVNTAVEASLKKRIGESSNAK